MICDNTEILFPQIFYFIRKVSKSNCGTPKEKTSLYKGSSCASSAIF